MRDRLVRLGWTIAALLLAAVLAAFYIHRIGWIAGSIVAAVAVLAAVRPHHALVAIAFIGPLSTILFVYGGVRAGGLRVFEALVLAFLAGWSVSHALRPSALQIASAVRASAALLTAAAIASALVTGAVVLTEQFADVFTGIRDGSWYTGYAVTWSPISAALLFVEGVVLAVAAADACAGDGAKRDAVLRAMAIGAAGAAFFNVRRIVMIALARENPWDAFATFILSLRVNVHHGDLNAAGSYFALALFLALGLMTRARVIGSVSAALIAAALWISGSRTAFAAVFIALGGLGLFRLLQRGRRRTAIALAVAGIAFAVTVLWAGSPARRNTEPSLALAIRVELARAALRMTADHPVFGVGLGRFFALSEPYTNMPLYIVRENAHNNFLQVLAELGIPGLALFLSVIGFAFATSLRRGGAAPPPSWPLLGGLSAFLLTCIGGHPLLVSHAAYPFWMALGLAAVARSAPPARAHARIAVAAAAVALLATVPLRTGAAVASGELAGSSAGFSKWQRQPDGSRYRWAGGRATFYVPSSARFMRVPLQRGPEAPEIVEVRVLLDGREANRVLLGASEEWQNLRLLIPQGDDEGAFRRIDLETRVPGAEMPLQVEPTDTGGVLKVGRPLFEE